MASVYQLIIPCSGALDFRRVAAALGMSPEDSLRAMAAKIGLNPPDVFPDDFYCFRYFGFERRSETIPAEYTEDFIIPFFSFNDVTIDVTIEGDDFFNAFFVSGSNGYGYIQVHFSTNNTGGYRTGSIIATNNVTGDNVSMSIVQPSI